MIPYYVLSIIKERVKLFHALLISIKGQQMDVIMEFNLGKSAFIYFFTVIKGRICCSMVQFNFVTPADKTAVL